MIHPPVEELRPYLQSFDFRNLFVEGLGWNHHHGQPVHFTVDGYGYVLQPLTEKAGFVVYLCEPGADGAVPPYPVRRKIEHQTAKLSYEHMIVFVDEAKTTQVWQWVKREVGKPVACREHPFHAGRGGDPLLQRLRTLAVTLDEEEGLTVGGIASRVRQAMDVERLTKRFYERFKKELAAFQRFIDGIAAQGDREWYASLMLNRMMFVYFVQKQGFLDGDPDYLRNRLAMVQRQQHENGTGRFHQFYRLFLLRLFHEGLGQPEAQRTPDLAELLGRVPFLNGGLFEVHDLEHDNPEISIPDEAFEKVFAFFDGYRWHLDERPHREDNEINPDVLGYIFEKYVNQKQMGAYYTKEDITGYISRNTVIPFLFDAARKKCRVAFQPGGGVWRLLQDDPDRYIYPAVGHGMAWKCSPNADAERLERVTELPDEIAAGVDDVSLRDGWNRLAPETYALPTETWREVVTRRQRYADVRAKLVSGEVHDINDLITLNLDIERFAKDVIVQSEGTELLRAFWHAIRDVSVLDPTCGSGAFLFAALNILEPLYSSCIEGMRGFLDDLNRTKRPHHPRALHDFRDVIAQVDRHPSVRYFILKSIVLHNLYGVDIMEEAVEICKLRLFLKLVAQLERYEQIEPLPDIDFNIRVGNTLVGFTSLDAVHHAITMDSHGQKRALYGEDHATLDRINESAETASRAFHQFRKQQTALGGDVTATDKANLRSRLDALESELNRFLSIEYRIKPQDCAAYANWRDNHKPFHWFVEFFDIMSRGGFDIVVGNPPFVEYTSVRSVYQVRGLDTLSCGNLYAYVTESSIALLRHLGRFGFIAPISLTAAQRMAPLQDYIFKNNSIIWLSNFALRPAALFPGIMQRNTICITKKGKGGNAYTSHYVTWYSEERVTLFSNLNFLSIQHMRLDYSIPKVNTHAGQRSLSKVLAKRNELTTPSHFKGSNSIFYHNAGGYWIKTFTFRPHYRSLIDPKKTHTTISELRIPSVGLATVYCALMNSNLFYFFWKSLTDARHVYPSDIASFPIDFGDAGRMAGELSPLVDRLMDEFRQNAKRVIYGNAEVDQYFVAPSKATIDAIDHVLSQYYGFTDHELDFILNYDIKYRMGSSPGGRA
ncbi:MAG: hypothetical protein OXP69_22390 [Spirochaetaceae bacterium]|nr:hypothetical protein [Spirochaetaceae bacterium]